jgi:hypothetical protein
VHAISWRVVLAEAVHLSVYCWQNDVPQTDRHAIHFLPRPQQSALILLTINKFQHQVQAVLLTVNLGTISSNGTIVLAVSAGCARVDSALHCSAHLARYLLCFCWIRSLHANGR